MKDIKTLIILIMCSILCMAAMHRGGAGTYQAAISDDGMVLVVVDTRNGGYKILEIETGDREKELFNTRERVIKWDDSGKLHQIKSMGETSLFKSADKPTLFKSPEETNLFK